MDLASGAPKSNSRFGRMSRHNYPQHPDSAYYNDRRFRRFGRNRGGFGGLMKLVLLGGVVYFVAKGVARSGSM